MKKILLTASVYSLATFFSPSAIAQINSNTTISGNTDALSFLVQIYPEAQHINTDGKIWLALIKDGKIKFHTGSGGFVEYTGGNALPLQQINWPLETIHFQNWNTRDLLGNEVYIGIGTNFEEMLSAGRYKKIHTLENYIPRVVASNSSFYCSNPYQYIVVNYVSYQTTIKNNTTKNISRINMNLELILPNKPLPIKHSGYYTIPGGLAPGASTTLNLQPNMFSDFAEQAKPYCSASWQTSLTVNITSAVDGDGVTISW